MRKLIERLDEAVERRGVIHSGPDTTGMSPLRARIVEAETYISWAAQTLERAVEIVGEDERYFAEKRRAHDFVRRAEDLRDVREELRNWTKWVDRAEETAALAAAR